MCAQRLHPENIANDLHPSQSYAKNQTPKQAPTLPGMNHQHLATTNSLGGSSSLHAMQQFEKGNKLTCQLLFQTISHQVSRSVVLWANRGTGCSRPKRLETSAELCSYPSPQAGGRFSSAQAKKRWTLMLIEASEGTQVWSWTVLYAKKRPPWQ